MAWKARVRLLFVCIVGLMLAGCNSQIQTYDSTFTASVTEETSTAAAAAKIDSMRLKAAAKLKKPYFIEFRARKAYTYGHAAVVFGKLDRNGKIPVDNKGVLNPKMVQISGLHPATTSTVPWSVGHVVPVPAETGPSDGDFEDAYVAARYRVDLTEKEFRKVVAIVNKHKRQNKVWYAPVFATNCLGYISSIAKDMGLKVPKTAKLPKEYVNAMKAANS